MDRIEINRLRVTAVVGVLPHEREQAQPLELDIALDVDLRRAGNSDALAHTVHYGLVTDRAAAIVRREQPQLLERLAELIAQDALSFEGVAAAAVTIRKLRPPIAEDVANTSVHVRRQQHSCDAPASARPSQRAIIALGSNLGDRSSYLNLAVEHFAPHVVAMSQVFETAPIGGPDQQDAFLNMVIAVETDLDPYALLRRCHSIEAEANRVRTVRWGPRTLDVDVLFYGSTVIASDELTVPHPRTFERRFVLAPLAEVAPELCPTDWQTTLPPDDVTAIGQLSEVLGRAR